jgi:Putative F0F1-ATPase subunit Ca2+/Mg2+ transporter
MMQPKSPQEKQQSAIRATAKYGGMAFQLLGACFVGVYAGKWLDTRLGYDHPVWAVFLTVFFMVAALYALYRQLLKD